MAEKTEDQLIAEWRGELSSYLQEMYRFSEIADPLAILKKLSSMGARVRYMQFKLSRAGSRTAKNVLFDEINPFLEEVDLQFRIWSRVGALMKDEWEQTLR